MTQGNYIQVREKYNRNANARFVTSELDENLPKNWCSRIRFPVHFLKRLGLHRRNFCWSVLLSRIAFLTFLTLSTVPC